MPLYHLNNNRIDTLAVLTGGSTAGTIGGAAVGGVIGNQVGKDKQ